VGAARLGISFRPVEDLLFEIRRFGDVRIHYVVGREYHQICGRRKSAKERGKISVGFVIQTMFHC